MDLPQPYANRDKIAEVYANLGWSGLTPSETYANLGWEGEGEGWRAKRAIAGIAVIADIARDRKTQNLYHRGHGGTQRQGKISPLIRTDDTDRRTFQPSPRWFPVPR